MLTDGKMHRWYVEALSVYRAGFESVSLDKAPAGVGTSQSAEVAYKRGVADGGKFKRSGKWPIEGGRWRLPLDLWQEVFARKTAGEPQGISEAFEWPWR